jgi:enediyne polyketide synthase
VTRAGLDERERMLMASAQDAELLLFGGVDTQSLRSQLGEFGRVAPSLSRAELGDLATQLARTATHTRVRAAIVAFARDELVSGLVTLHTWLDQGVTAAHDLARGAFLGSGTARPRIGFLFPGQGAPAYLDGGALRGRFPFVDELYERAALPRGGNGVATEVAQPAIVVSSLAALAVLERLGVSACVAVGHSLGELTALCWAGALSEDALLRIAKARGQAMQALGDGDGAMASLSADETAVRAILGHERVVIAGVNGPNQTVISGTRAEVQSLVARARAAGIVAELLRVSHAFHSEHVAAAVPALRAHLAAEVIGELKETVLSTVTGQALDPLVDVRDLLCRQVVEPVRFAQAATRAAEETDLLIEVGPGRILGGLLSTITGTPVVSIDAGSPSLAGLLKAAGFAYTLGAPLHTNQLAEGRFVRPLTLGAERRFLASPCEAFHPARPPRPDRSDPTTDRIPLGWAPVLYGEMPELLGLNEASPVAPPPAQPVTSNGDLSEIEPLELVRQIVARRAELPLDTIAEGTRLLRDLNLNSITIGQIAAEAARALGLRFTKPNSEFSDLSVVELATALSHLVAIGAAPDAAVREPPGVGTWIRPYVVRLVERPLTPGPDPSTSEDPGWTVIAESTSPIAEQLAGALRSVKRRGVAVCIPAEPVETEVHRLLLEGARVARFQNAGCFLLVQHGGGGAGFVRTLHLEKDSRLTTCVVDVPNDRRAVPWIVAEAAAATGHTEAYYDAGGRRRVPVWCLHTEGEEERELPLGGSDVILVTGGGKGIAAECALALATETGARLALLGRSRPEEDADLAANLERIGAATEMRYFVADVTDPRAVRKAVAEAQATFGSITAVIHGAGTNTPKLIDSLDGQACRDAFGPKVTGALNVLASLDRARLKLFVAFGSIIARVGLKGEAHYALANEWLTKHTEQLSRELPSCRCVSLEWSVWSGVGMGARLDVIEALEAQGVTPITPDEGIRWLRRLIAQPATPAAVIVTGRFGRPPTVEIDEPKLPLLRFLEQPRVYYPGIELVIEAKLSSETDPYLDDHTYQNVRLFPAVLGLEAMAQANAVLTESLEVPLFEDVLFERPITVPSNGATTIQIAALRRDDGSVELNIRSEETGFAVSHFSAVCRQAKGDAILDGHVDGTGGELKSLADDLYGPLLFQSGRFRRLAGYHRLGASEFIAQIAPDGTSTWFAALLPQTLLLGDPGARDASLHATQAGWPRGRLLPFRIAKLAPARLESAERSYSWIREGSTADGLHYYDIDVARDDGAIIEHWEAVGLRQVDRLPVDQPSIPALLGPYIERRVREFVPGSDLSFVLLLEADATSDDALRLALNAPLAIARRPDGKPEARGGRDVSVSHGAGLLAAVASARRVGCDVEPVETRERELWLGLLGPARLGLAAAVVTQAGDDPETAATRVWGAVECLKKAGVPPSAPLTFAKSDPEGWVIFDSGSLVVSTFSCRVQGTPKPTVIAILAERASSVNGSSQRG